MSPSCKNHWTVVAGVADCQSHRPTHTLSLQQKFGASMVNFLVSSHINTCCLQLQCCKQVLLFGDCWSYLHYEVLYTNPLCNVGNIPTFEEIIKGLCVTLTIHWLQYCRSGRLHQMKLSFSYILMWFLSDSKQSSLAASLHLVSTLKLPLCILALYLISSALCGLSQLVLILFISCSYIACTPEHQIADQLEYSLAWISTARLDFVPLASYGLCSIPSEISTF